MNDVTPPEGAFGLPMDEQGEEGARVTLRRDRLLASFTLIAGLGLILAMPFALKEGAEFFLPVTMALVIAVALVPLLEWFERRRLPSPIAAFVCVAMFLTAAGISIVAIVMPATEFFRKLPERIDRIQMNLAPVLELYATLEKYLNRTVKHLAAAGPVHPAATSAVTPPSSVLELAATTAPSLLIQIFFGILIVYFFLSHWTRIRRNTITNRASFDGAMATARVIQEVVDDVAAYLGTITLINLCLGAVIAFGLWMVGMPFPIMWGGIAALLNYVPYFGPIAAAFLLAVGGLMVFTDIWVALIPPAIMIGCHLVEANVITPLVVGHRLTINPVLILISISFWGWVWGTPGAVLAVPLLIILQTVMAAAGKPDIAGFLFEHGTLTQTRRARFGRGGNERDTGG